MAMSQSLDDSPWKWGSKKTEPDPNLQALYNERHRLALEELLSAGVDSFLDFLRREGIPNFLSDDEIRRVRGAAVRPRCVSVVDLALEQSVTGSVDCSSVTYFPDVSDVEPPLLELGWPAFTSGSYRGVTRAVAHFQPSYGECIYSCKEAARRMIKSAKEVIAIVTDSLTDLDIFRDLQEACTHRKVPVYILLDQSCAPAFLKMCSSVNVRLDDLQKMRVRIITGTTYYMRSGARITGKVHERFMLIDGNRVATGSYRFNWTDGRLNTSNLIELSGQITETFDEEFRILYAQSLPVNTRAPPISQNSGLYEHLLIKHPVAFSPHTAREIPAELLCLTSTPNSKPHTPAARTPCKAQIEETGRKSMPVSDSSTIGKEEQHEEEEILAGSATRCFPAVVEPLTPVAPSCHVSTQTSWPTADSDAQTEPESILQHATERTTQEQATAPLPSDPRRSSPRRAADRRRRSSVAPDGHLKERFHKLTTERQGHYSNIRTKLEYMVSTLYQRQELADVTNMPVRPERLRPGT